MLTNYKKSDILQKQRQLDPQSKPIDVATSRDMQATPSDLASRAQQISISARRAGQDDGAGRTGCRLQRNHEPSTSNGRPCATPVSRPEEQLAGAPAYR